MKLAISTDHIDPEVLNSVASLEEFETIKSSTPFEDLMSGVVSAIVIPLNQLQYQTEEEPTVIAALLQRTEETDHIHWRNNIPKVSNGIIALVCLKNDFDTRKELIEWNDQETMFCSNVERAIQKKSKLKQIHCFKDRVGRYQLGIAKAEPILNKDLFYAQSTFAGLVDLALKDIGI